jgi:hypothetical protein
MRPCLAAALSAALLLPAVCVAKAPPCASWPTNMALVVLKDAGITDPTRLDESKTKAVRIASEKLNNKDRYRQVYEITFTENSGRQIQVVTSSIASSQECSMSSVDVYVVAKKYNSNAPL